MRCCLEPPKTAPCPPSRRRPPATSQTILILNPGDAELRQPSRRKPSANAFTGVGHTRTVAPAEPLSPTSPLAEGGRDGQHSIELRSYAAPARQPPVELTLPLTELGDTFGESVHEDVEPSSPLLEQQQRVDGSASAPRSTVPQPPTEATTAASS